MDLTLATLGGRTTITLVGRFDAHEARRFRDVATPAVETGSDVAVDLSEVAFIDSTALAELVRMSRTAQERGSAFRLRNVSVPVKVILELTGLNLALDVEEDRSVVERT